MEFADTVEEVEVGTINGVPAVVAVKGRCRAGDVRKCSAVRKAGLNLTFRELLLEDGIDYVV